MVRLGRALGRGLAPPKFQGIRFRLGLWLAAALLPVLVLGAFQTQSAFRAQDLERRSDLQLAAERAAASAKARLDSTGVLLQALRPEALEVFCEPRLTDLVERLDDLDGLARLTATGQPDCASASLVAARPAWMEQARATPWFERLRAGESTVLARAPATGGRPPGLIVAIRLERPMGRFDGAMAALIPLSSLQPDVEDPALPEASEAALTDAEGRLLTATDSAAFTLTGGVSLTGWVERARSDASGIFEAENAAGRRRVYAGAALAGRDVYALLSAPAPGLLSWARLNPVGALFMPLLTWLIAFSAVMLVSERIVIRWLGYLERVAAIYARGRFSVRPVQAINAPAEIRVLARTLDELAESIAARDAALTASLAEKDALMREIHHRVKNNLQIISSLLSMQQRALTDPKSKAAVGDTRQRISALALIYRTLYQSDDLRFADARIFLTELVGQLVASESGRGQLVTSSVEADSLVVDPDKLAPLALWLVEAVTNAQKHAFAGRGGDLKVRFSVRGDTSVLEVQDDGPGVSETLRAGVGRTLMGAFAKQLRGEVEMVPAEGGGTIARMTFATPEAVAPTDPADLGTPAGPRR
ncbi:sensor histidine kinase [Brevundimonas sp.]|uniref:sensor histidine kinase PhyK n=1 Tax=Brevundimonas sp. TaxID=1871086 RepID=UPI002737F9D1|nr:histidine kinase dimerization/phosphoacceptor domain -containing protein [Brevundimonas sp.]MDP3802144.1 histidine kinase dimerization/phosphoacceptor domain -containing protein [Brevundimonas sp.]